MHKIIFLSALLLTLNSMAELSDECLDSDYVEGFNGMVIKTSGKTYTPKCVIVPLGAVVSIEASGFHPLVGVPNENAPNPIPVTESVKSTATYQFTNVETFEYFCTKHGSAKQGMYGAIKVVN